ncbi:MAG: hypothetical protein K2X60_10470 [Xanthobacteraceae bacterium]|nr:hypothetical protein [Xanthobacteraceae bacterium]
MKSRLPLSPSAAHDGALHWLLLAGVFAIAMALRHSVAANTDVSWLLTVCEKVLKGQRLYTDIIETNPPIAMLAYLPSVMLEHALGVRAEIITDALVFVAVALSMFVAARIVRCSTMFGSGDQWPLAIFCAAVLTIVPMQTFSQREHLAFVAFLPALAVLILRAQNLRVPLWAVIAAGLGAGVTLMFKPYFILGIGTGIIAAAACARSWRALFAPENFVAAAMVAVYTASIYLFYPDYFTQIYPLVRDVYLLFKRPMTEMVGSTGVLAWAVALIVALLIKLPRKPDASATVLIAASIGFAAAYFLQRKGWAYQSYPMIALALIALGYAISTLPGDANASRAARIGGLGGLAGLFLLSLQWMNDASNARVLEEPVARLGPHPKLLMLSAEASIGHPLVRAVGGEWVSRQQGLWVREFVKRLRSDHLVGAEQDEKLDAYAARERAMLIEDIKKIPPTVVLVDNLLSDWGAWLRADPELSELLKPYRLSQTVQHIDILKRAN